MPQDRKGGRLSPIIIAKNAVSEGLVQSMLTPYINRASVGQDRWHNRFKKPSANKMSLAENSLLEVGQGLNQNSVAGDWHKFPKSPKLVKC